MPVVIQPWDKEYWSKSARQRLFDEYAQGDLERKKNLASEESRLVGSREEAADQRRRQREMELQSAEFTNRLKALQEEYGLRGEFEEGPSLRAKQALLNTQIGADTAAAERDAKQKEIEMQKQRDFQRSMVTAKQDAERADDMEFFRGEAHKQLRAKGIPESDVYRLGEELAAQAVNNKRGLDLALERTRATYGIENPSVLFPGVYATDVKREMADEKTQALQDLMDRLAPKGAGGVAAPSGAPVVPRLKEGGKVIKLGAPKRRSELDEYLNINGY